MKKRCLAILVALTILLSLNICAFADTTASEARNGVAVLATCAQINGGTPTPWAHGTCFFIGNGGENPQYMLTNYHVVQDYLEYGRGETISTGEGVLKMLLRVYYSNNDYAEAYLVDYDEAQDTALLRLAAPTDKRSALKLHIPDDSLVGSQIYTIGYPGYADYIDPTTTWGINDSLVTKGTIGRLSIVRGSGTQWLQLADTQWNGGNSGGPLVADDGAVVGMVSWGYSDESKDMYLAVNIESVIPMLNNNGVEYELVGEGLPSWLLPAAIAAVAAVLLVVVIVIVAKKLKKKDLVVRIATVRSLAAQHAGQRAVVGSQQVFIGRQSNCAIIFANNTPGVSGVHCSLSWDKNTGDFTLTDLKSTYGTFLVTGQKLNPHVPYRLRNGDSFYLGEMSNMLRVEVE